MGEKGNPRARIKKCVFLRNAAPKKEWWVVGLPHRAASRARTEPSKWASRNTVPNSLGINIHESQNPTGLGSPVSPMANTKGGAAFSPAASVPPHPPPCPGTVQGHGVGGVGRKCLVQWQSPWGSIIVNPEEESSALFPSSSLCLGGGRGINRSPWERDLS